MIFEAAETPVDKYMQKWENSTIVAENVLQNETIYVCG